MRLSQSLQVCLKIKPNARKLGYSILIEIYILQMQLEKIRAADTSVRWQDEDDVEQCPSCKSSFAVTRRKVRITFIININVEFG